MFSTIRAWLACATVVLLPFNAFTQTQEVAQLQEAEFKRLSIEELAQIDVTSVARRLEPVSESPAAIQVLTQDDLHRAGVVYLVEALRLADAMFVGRFDGRTWIAQPRGLAINGANKMQVLLDGRSLYSPLYSGIFWDVQDYPIKDIERIEIIRGPGASLWGANAVNGVINVITKDAAHLTGTLASIGVGTEDRFIATLRHGGPIGNAHYRVYTKATYRDAQVLSSGVSAEDPLRRGQAGFRADWSESSRNQFTLQGDAYIGRLGLLGSADTPVSGGNILGRWTHVTTGGQRWEGHAYYDRVARTVPNQVGEKRNTFNVEAHQELTAGRRHHVVWGGGYRVSSDDTAHTIVFFEPPKRTTHLLSVFAQDEVALDSRTAVTLGAKLERNAYTGLELQPTIRGRFTLGRPGMVWGAISRAVRMPTRFDTDIRVAGPGGLLLASGNPEFASEQLIAYEGGLRSGALGPVSFDIAVYRNVYDYLRSQEFNPGAPALVTLGNTIEGHIAGAEFGVNVQAAPGVQIHGSYTRMARALRRKPGSLDITGGEGNDPRHMGTLQVFTSPSATVTANLLLRFVGTLPNPPTAAYTEADATMNWIISPRWELQLVGQNLLHPELTEFPQAAPVFERVQRNVYARFHFRIR